MNNKVIRYFICILVLLMSIFLFGCDIINPKEKNNINFIYDGETIKTIQTSGNESITLPTINCSDDYEFIGWFYDNNTFSNEFTKDDYKNKSLTSDINVYAYVKELSISLDLSIDGFTNSNNTFTIAVDNTIDTFDFNNKIQINNKLSYTIKSSNNESLNDLVSLAYGDNEFTITVSDNKNNTKDYKVIITRTKAYTVTFNTNGGTKVDSVTVKEGSTINEPTTTKEGYDFVSWDYDFNNPIKSDILVSASWIAKTYTITYVLNGGTNDKSNLESYTVDTIFTLKDAKKDGYNFVGWYSDSDCTQAFSTLTLGDVTLYAKFSTAKTYTITYNLNGGTNNTLNPTSYTVENDNIVLKDPTKEGYTFGGWYTNNLLTIKIDTIYSSVCANYTLYAKWNANKYTITLDADGGKLSSNTVTVWYNASYTLPTPTKENAEFDGWYNGTTKVVNGTYKETNSITLKAKWIPLYTISYYDGSNKLSLDPTNYNGKTKVTLPTITKDGYNFLGWYSDKALTNKVESIEVNESGNKTFYANFVAKEPVEVKVTYDLNGGELEGYVNKGFDYSNPKYSAKATMYLVYDSTNGYYASVAETTGNMYFTYILLKKTTYTNVYEIVEIAYPRSNITVSDYDLLIAWHGALKDSESYTILNTIYANRDTFTNGYVYLTNVPTSKSSDCNIGIQFYTSDAMDSGNPVTTLKEKVTLPTPTKSGYDFLGWKSSVDGEIIKEYPAYIDNMPMITYTAQWIKQGLGGTSLADALAYLNNYMIDYATIKENIDLPTEVEGCSVNWKSSNSTILTDKGVVSLTYAATNVTLTATITDGKNTETINFNIKVEGQMKDLTNGVVGGYFYYSQSVDEYTYKNIDIMYLAFAYIQPDGSISNYESIKSQAKAKATTAHKYGTRVVISIQHKSALTDFSTVAASESLCETFATNCMNLLVDTGCDGIDLDWEWPSSSQVASFTRLTKAIYTKIKSVNEHALLTSACGSYQSTRYDLENSIKYFDFINIMTYDMQVSTASFQNALYSSTGNSSYYCDGSVKAYLKLVPANKLILGVPFYGRQFKGCTTGLKSGSFEKSTTHTYIVQTYLNNAENVAKYRVWDDTAKVPYIYDKANNIIITYDDEESIAIKCEYSKSKGLAGLMYWQDSQDYGNTLLEAMVNGVAKNYKGK